MVDGGGDVVHLVPARHRGIDRLRDAILREVEDARAQAPRDEDWRYIVASAIGAVVRAHGLEPELAAEIMAPTQHHAWESLTAALDAWPGPCPAEAPAWRRLAQATTNAEREAARAELRELGIDPG